MPRHVQGVSPDEQFDFQPSGFDTVFTLSRIPADETTKMLKRHTKRRPGGEMEVDNLTFNREYRARAIKGWVGYKDVKGEEYPDTVEARMAIPNDIWGEIQQAIGAGNIEDFRAHEASLKN